MSVAAIVLAAGASTRLGQPKQLVMMGGERLLDRAVRIAREAGCEPVVVVLGSQADVITSQCGLAEVRIVYNMRWQEGLASSLRAGIAALPGTASAAVVMTCDQPAVSVQHLRALMEMSRDQPVASFYAERNGVPACFPRSTFEELRTLAGDAGARALLETALHVTLLHGDVDVDTPEALEAAKVLFD